MIENKVLIVDDDWNVLKALQRKFDDKYELSVAVGPIEGLKTVEENGPFAVVISDMQMPEMSGIDMLMKIKELYPDTIRIILTGFADLDVTIDAVNRGNIFRFLSKPCPNEILESAIQDGIRQNGLITAEKELVEGTLLGSVKVLSDVLALVNPVAFGRASRVKRMAVKIAMQLGLENVWEIEIASMLSALGCVTITESTLNKLAGDGNLTSEEKEAFKKHPAIGKSLLENIPRMQNVAEIVAYQEKHFDGGGFPNDAVVGENIPFGARILKATLDLDTEENRTGSAHFALCELKNQAERYDPKVLGCLESILDQIFDLNVQALNLSQLKPGMVIAANILNKNDQLLIAKGQEITRSVLRHLSNFAIEQNLKEPIKVFSSSIKIFSSSSDCNSNNLVVI